MRETNSSKLNLRLLNDHDYGLNLIDTRVFLELKNNKWKNK